jgi:hypothetical protein
VRQAWRGAFDSTRTSDRPFQHALQQALKTETIVSVLPEREGPAADQSSTRCHASGGKLIAQNAQIQSQQEVLKRPLSGCQNEQSHAAEPTKHEVFERRIVKALTIQGA